IDSGESLFITQSRTKAVRTERRLGSSKRPESVSDDSGNGRENEDTENERGSGGQRAECPKRRKSSIYISTRKTTFPFLLKSLRRQHLSSKKHQILEVGIISCSPNLLIYFFFQDRTVFVPSYFKGNKQKWLPQSFLEMRIQGSLSDDNEEQLFNTKGKEKKRKTKSTKKNKATRTSSESSVDSLFMEQEKRHETHEVLASCSDAEHSDSAHCRHRLTKQTVQCAGNLDGDHLVVIEETQRNSLEAVTEAAVHMEHDDNASSPSLFTSKVKKKKKYKLKEQEEAESGADNVHSVEMDQFSETQTTEMPPKRTKKKRKDKERTKTAHVEDNSGTDILSNETSETVEERPSDVLEHTEAELNDAEHSDFVQCAENSHLDHLSVIEDRQRNSVEAVTEPAVEHEDDLTSDNNLLNKSNSLLPPQGGDISIQNDIQQTDSDFGSEDLFRPLNSQKQKNNQIHKTASIPANMEESDQDSDVTQIETEGPFVSIFGPGTPRWCDGDRHAHEDNDSDETQIETEGKSMSVFGPGTPNKQFTTQDMNSTKHPESQKTDQIPETMNVQPPSKHLPLADEPLKEVYSISSERLKLSKRRAMEEMETDPQETPLFTNGGLSFIKRKRKEKLGATNFIQCDTNVDVSSESPVDNITGVKTTPRENEKSHEVENRVTNEEQREASVLHLEETSEILEESVLSMVADNSVITKVKRKKKKDKLKEHEPSVENQSVETVQFSESQ
uniref:Uncharacterized LOC107665014 n=1 Tax=Sinocyclocheilus anshuiensis TaxID=1608454 RepID=A0A671K1J9_9TELE